MNLYDATIPVFTKMLRNLDGWIEKTMSFAQEKKFDPENLFQARLAPDQFAFCRQVQSVCDSAKLTSARLAGKEAPSHPDTEKTLEELRARIRTCSAYLETLKRDDFKGAEERSITTPAMKGKAMRGGDYLDHYALPNFYFHLTTAYAILRHSGVALGKMDFLGTLPFVS